jgi:hypothetical protein
MYTNFVPFRPALEGIFLERFTQVASDFFSVFTSLPYSEREVKIQTTVRRETQWAVSDFTVNPQQRRIYRAVWLLLNDLVKAGWQCRWRIGTLEIASPHVPPSASGNSAIQEAKDQIRQAMRPARLAKISEAKAFIERMERPQPGDEAQVSITALIAEGKQLAKKLEHIQKSEKPECLEQLQQVIQPYLQLLESGEYCKFTGHRLHDIWRYFRYMWSSPAEPTPGRTMLYLVRDAAQPYHPVMGIASLENAALQSPDRDAFFGWTVNAFQQNVNRAEEVEVQTYFEQLLRYISQAITDIDYRDLCEPQELEQPDADLLYRLREIAEEAELDRQTAVFHWQHDQNGKKSDLGNISQATEDALYLRKRAEALRKLLYARIKINELLQNQPFDWQEFLSSIEGQTAIRTALHAEKNRYIGTSILEVNVCGAIPPYNHLLGGKLVALLMLSPRVVADYRRRYGGRESDIASRMKGEAVVKPAELVYVGTTSLYRVGSSQYNRLKLPAEITESGQPLAWQYIGETRGHGTLHISRQTILALEEIIRTDYVNHVFGEGASPKMRQIRHALNAIMSPGQSFISSVIIQHAMNRPIYGAWLATNGAAYLLGEETQPEYHFDTFKNPEQGTKRVIDYWVNRWLLSRLEYKPALDKVRSTRPTDLLISRELPLQQETIFEPIPYPDEAKKMIKENDVQANDAQLCRSFYNELWGRSVLNLKTQEEIPR